MKLIRNGLLRVVVPIVALCLFAALFLNVTEQETVAGPQGDTGRLEKMIVAGGTVNVEIDFERLNAGASRSRMTLLGFEAPKNAFFTVMAFNDEFRGTLPSSMELSLKERNGIRSRQVVSFGDLMLESSPFGTDHELMIRDSKTGFHYFNIEGHIYDYDAYERLLAMEPGRLLISEPLAERLGRPSDAGTVVGHISATLNMRVIEIAYIVNGEVAADTLPALREDDLNIRPGPDVVVGDIIGLAQFGSSVGGRVGLAVGTDSCNFGTVDLNWFALPSNDHPVIPQNLYRMSGGANNNERFEQIGQSNVKHAFTALTQNICQLGCNGVGGSRLGSGCSDPYSASLNAGPNLGSRAWINPYTGAFPRGDSATPPNNHSGHAHTGTSHRVLTNISDLVAAENPGATYYAEAQYVTPHEFAWCQANPGQCNMYNNVSYRRYNVSGTTSFTFSAVGSTVREKVAVMAWPDATFLEIRPAPGVDGIGTVAHKVTNPSPGVWHYEYAIHNQNLDRAIREFAVPIGQGVVIENIGFHAPPQHPGWTFDGTSNNAGYSETPWATDLSSGSLTWSTETFAQNPNANAIRWGTMYNFRFRSNRPPTVANATIGFYKTGDPINVLVQVPSAVAVANVSVSGRILTAGGRGIGYATVSLTDSQGNIRVARSNLFGFYQFDNVATGTGYNVSVSSRQYTFTPQVIDINDNIFGLDFVAQ